jgi:hypothetical protein
MPCSVNEGQGAHDEQAANHNFRIERTATDGRGRCQVYLISEKGAKLLKKLKEKSQ